MVALAGACLASAGFFVAKAPQIDSYIWLVDELLNLKYAVGYGTGDFPLPLIHGERIGAPNALHALLMSPFSALGSAVDAFNAGHVIGALAFTSVLFPVALIARGMRLGSGWAIAGLLSVWVPWGVSTLTLMTEPVAYAAFAWAICAMTRAITRPSPKRDALALLAICIAVFARTQFVLLVEIFVAAIGAHALGGPRWRSWKVHLRARPTALGRGTCRRLALAPRRRRAGVAGGLLLGRRRQLRAPGALGISEATGRIVGTPTQRPWLVVADRDPLFELRGEVVARAGSGPRDARLSPRGGRTTRTPTPAPAGGRGA